MLFEIKPDDEESRVEGREQAGRYLAALNKALEPDRKLVGGTGFEGALFLEFENGGALWKLSWRTPEPGVTLYRWSYRRKKPGASWKERAAQKEEELLREEVEQRGELTSRARSTCLWTVAEPGGRPPPFSGGVKLLALEEHLSAVLGRKAMSTQQPPALEFPAMLHGSIPDIRRKVRAEGQWWAREYLEAGTFPQPRQMRQVPPGELLVMHSGADFDSARPRWRVNLFVEVFIGLNEGVQKEERQRMRDAFESFCLSTSWGALYHAVSPPPLRSAERMANRLASVLRFWDVLQGLRYAFWVCAYMPTSPAARTLSPTVGMKSNATWGAPKNLKFLSTTSARPILI